jgi:hypothetical protein
MVMLAEDVVRAVAIYDDRAQPQSLRISEVTTALEIATAERIELGAEIGLNIGTIGAYARIRYSATEHARHKLTFTVIANEE